MRQSESMLVVRSLGCETVMTNLCDGEVGATIVAMNSVI